jgi:outer membrane immunogenic protein
VLGVESQFSWSDVEGTAPCVVVLSCTTQINWIADVAGRVGVVVAGHTLVYVKGGVAFADSDYSASFNVIPALQVTATANDTRVGTLLGIGAEYAVAAHWSAKIEYNYIDFGTEAETFNFTVPIIGIPGTATADVTQQLHTIKAGFNYRF